MEELFKIGTPVRVLINGNWYNGYYAGLTRWGLLHYVTVKKATGSNRQGQPGWIVEHANIERR